MAYSTVAGVSAYFGSPDWSVNTKPTLAEITNWCDESAAVIDGYIADTVTTPVTDTTDLKIITSISDMYVVDNITFVMSKNRTMMQQSGSSVPRSISHKAFYERLDMIKNGTILLVGTIESTKSSVFSGAYSNELTFVAAKDTQQW